jgi:hypothetical protein
VEASFCTATRPKPPESWRRCILALGLKESSARQYLKLTFGKTGARRQADLIRLVGQTLKRSI